MSPRTYTAWRSVSPVSSTMVGVPPAVPTRTVSLNMTCTSMSSLIPYVPSAESDATLSTIGFAVSGVPIVIPFAASAPDESIAGRVRLACVPVFMSVIMPPSPAASDDLFT